MKRYILHNRASRLAPAIKGGNWQGVEYLTYAEHDRCVRATFGAGGRMKKGAYEYEKQQIIKARNQNA